MSITDYIAIAVIVLIVGAAVFYLIRAKKRGEVCVGCPYAKQCAGKCGGCDHSKTAESKDKK
ncbi:MAG: FeoB-associated Cys-rich membrane protein [Clostridia bacterium]|nr:FeoB-associated Cys-rich membrane protein [Clostridia bacterium]